MAEAESRTLVERDEEWAQISAGLSMAADGRGSLTVIEASPGLGKTRLLEQARLEAELRGIRVLSASGGELESDIAFGVVRELFAPVLAREELAASPDAEHRLYWRLADLTEETPIAVLVDDGHWTDEASLRFLAYVARRVEGLALAVIVATRPVSGPGARPLRAIAAAPLSVTLAPAHLTLAGTQTLLTARLAASPEQTVVRAVHDATGGNPFLISELVDVLASESTAAGALERLREQAPETIVQAFDRRLETLGDEPRGLAGALAILGDGAILSDAAAIAGLSAQQAIDAYDALARAGLVHGGQVGFVHPIARTAIYSGLGAAARWRGHDRAAALLSARGAPDERVAHHLLQAPPAGDAVAARVLLAAGREARVGGSLPEAVALLDRAVREPPPADTRPQVLLELAEAQAAAGRHAESLATLHTIPPDGGLQVEASLVASRALAGTRDGAAAVRLLHERAQELEGDNALRLRVHAMTIGMYADPELAGVHQRWATRFEDLAADTPLQRHALAVTGLALGYGAEGTAERAAEAARRALTGPLGSDDIADYVATMMAINVLILADRYTEAAEAIDRHLEPGRRRGIPAAALAAQLSRLGIARGVGRIDEMTLQSDLAWVHAERPEDDEIVLRLSAYAGGTAIEAAVLRGDVDGARAIADDADRAGYFERPELVWLRYGTALLALWTHDYSRARDDFLHVGQIMGAGRYEFRHRHWRTGAARALAQLGDRDGALELVEAELAVARTWGTASCIGVALRHRAVVAGGPGVAEGLVEAVEFLRRGGQRLELAEGLIELGLAHRAAERSDARAAFEEAMDLAASLGAHGVAEQARHGLRLLGDRPRRHRISGLDALTPTERRIADLAAAGASNRQIAQELFVTIKTVEGHLSNVYRKLDLASRRDLAAALGTEL